jgi:hypothetical protein
LLVNELAIGEEMLDQFANAELDQRGLSAEKANRQIDEFKKLCAKAREAWALAVFSDACNETLERYFTYHLQVIADLSKKLSALPAYVHGECACEKKKVAARSFETAVNLLTDHLFYYFGSYPDGNILLPISYYRHCLNNVAPELELLRQSLRCNILPDLLKSAVLTYLDHVAGCHASGPLTYGQLAYFQKFVRELQTLLSRVTTGALKEAFSGKLLELEFNHMVIFTFFQEELKIALAGKTVVDKLSILQKQAALFRSRQTDNDCRYDLLWPKLSIMLAKWTEQEIENLKEPVITACSFPRSIKKLKLEISVAHLACLIRLFVNEKLPEGVPLTELFKFIADSFSTKRKETVSAGSLSKEYYSVTQVSAAEVKHLLLRMVSRISRDYFPVVAVISIIIHAR